MDVLNAQYRLLFSGHIARQKLNKSQITLLNSSNQMRMFSFFGLETPLINPASLMVVCPDGGGEQSEESDGGSQRAPPFLRL